MEFHKDRLIAFRKEYGMTQADLAEALGISQNQISTYERQTANPTIITLAKMAKLFNTTTDYLMGLTNRPDPASEPDPHINAQEAALLALMRTRSEQDQARLVRAVQALWGEDER